MTRQEAKELLPIIQAFAEGKTIQWKNKNRSLWNEASEENAKLSFNTFAYSYRIKPEPKYRPFKSQEECWKEMLKHQPFGWLKSKQWGSYSSIGTVGKGNGKGLIIRSTDECHKDCMDYIYEDFTFADGTPFGIKED